MLVPKRKPKYGRRKYGCVCKQSRGMEEGFPYRYKNWRVIHRWVGRNWSLRAVLAPSQTCRVMCKVCRYEWITRSHYVDKLLDATIEELRIKPKGSFGYEPPSSV